MRELTEKKNHHNSDRLGTRGRHSTSTSDTALKAAANCRSRGKSRTTAQECDAAAISVKNQEKGDLVTNCSHLKKGKCAFPANQNDPWMLLYSTCLWGFSAGIGSLYSRG